jgi:hypothetical protein
VPSLAHRPTTSLHTQAITKEVGAGKILSIVQKEERTNTPLASTSRSLIILMVDCRLAKKIAGLYAKSCGLEDSFGGLVETAAKYGAYWRLQIDPTKQIPEVAA